MRNKIGLKLWSTNDFYINSVIDIFEKNSQYCDYIELYVVPNSIDFLPKWKEMQKTHNIPFAIHGPHFSSGLDMSNSQKRNSNKKLIEQTKIYADTLESIYTIFHPGIGGIVDETISQMRDIKNLNFIVENKPFIVPMKDKDDAFCVGSTVKDIKRILSEVGCGFCLDIGHALCSANYQKINPYEYILEFNKLNPDVYHISDNDQGSVYDAHLHFGYGNIDFSKVFNIIDDDKFLAVETNKDSKENLDDFLKDSRFIKGING